MRKKIFLDANLLIDLTNAGNNLYGETLFLFNHFLKNKDSYIVLQHHLQ